LPSDIVNKLRGHRVIWLHAVSVGEVLASLSIIQSVRKEFPEHKLVISTVTRTGFDLAGQILKDDVVIYFPLDLTLPVQRVLNHIHPEIILIMETELWPNFITHVWLKNIPICLLNGRISPRSYNGYRRIRFLTGFLLKKIGYFSMQTEADAKRIIDLGAPEEKVKVTGNVKFDASYAQPVAKGEIELLRNSLGLKPDEKLWIAGSTHPGEENVILEVYQELIKEFQNIRLLIAPRHIERSVDVENLIKSYGFPCMRISQMKEGLDNPVLLLDQLGKLKAIYSAGELVFVGGSLIPHGGQNMIEPASLGKPVIFGPHIFNFQETAGLLLEESAGMMVRGKGELLSACRSLLKDETSRRRMGDLARKVVETNLGATTRNIEIIKKFIFPSPP
jgi:3-deoxy-D-manno-octulosonic-acid transferase